MLDEEYKEIADLKKRMDLFEGRVAKLEAEEVREAKENTVRPKQTKK